MRRRFLLGMLVVLLIANSLCTAMNMTPTKAGAPEEQGITTRHFLAKTGTYFEMTGSPFLNVTITSTEAVKIVMSAPVELIYYIVEPAGSSTLTVLTLGNLQPDTTYYMLEDRGTNEVEFTTDDSGCYSYVQDLSQPHHIYIRPYRLKAATPLT